LIEYTRLLWEEGERRLREVPADRSRPLERVVERLVAELRRRLGGAFTARELAELYDGSSAWTMAVAVQASPKDPLAWEQWVADAAFNRYVRDASDWPIRW
jgi:hypothetical protein